MRTYSREFLETQAVTTSVASETEDIIFISEDKSARMIQVKTNCFASNGIVVGRREYTISGDYYSLLMSQSPDFAPGKPENEYREVDLWYVIDLIDGA